MSDIIESLDRMFREKGEGKTEMPLWLWSILVLSVILAMVSNINHVSMHRFYRNRLMDAYMPVDLAAEAKRQQADKFNEDEKPEDRATRAETQGLKSSRASADRCKLAEIDENADAPYHIINTYRQRVEDKYPDWFPLLKWLKGEDA